MSADNGIYVLETAGPEFRVAYAQDIDNLYDGFDESTGTWVPNKDRLYETFAASKVYDDVIDALDFAEEELYKHDYLEYVVHIIVDFSNMRFYDG